MNVELYNEMDAETQSDSKQEILQDILEAANLLGMEIFCKQCE